MSNLNYEQFEIYIDYDKNADNPERVFLTLAKLVSEFSNFDSIVCDSLAIKIKSKMVLEKVENGSIKARFRYFLENIVDDEALRTLDWKRIIGNILIAGKYKLLATLNDSSEDKGSNLTQLQADIFELSKPLVQNSLKVNTPVPCVKLAKCIDGVNSAFNNLKETDKVKYITRQGSIDTKFNPVFSLAYEKTQLIEHSYANTYKVLLVVKKPDFLGDSQWAFIYDGKRIDAKIADNVWLESFHNREVTLQVKDSIECDLHIQTKDITGIKQEPIYTVTKVHKVIPFLINERQLKINEVL